MESVPSSFNFKPIFSLYKNLIRNSGIEDKLTVSTWLTVIETCRHSKEGLSDLLLYSKNKLNEQDIFNMFSTEGASESNTEMSPNLNKRSMRLKRPKSVLINKDDE